MTPARENPAGSGLAARTFAEIRDNFPVWFVVCLSGGHVLSALTFVQPPRYSSILTLMLPLFWAAVWYRLGRGDVRLDRSLAVVFPMAVVALTLVFWLPAWLAWTPGDPSALRLRFEVLAMLWAAVLLLHCVRYRGWHAALIMFLVGAVYGFALENGGIKLGYFSEAGYRFYVPLSRTPISSVAGWCTIFYPSVFIADGIIARFPTWQKHVPWPSALVTAIAISSDLHFDPLATALGMWVWNDSLAPYFLGVPLVNFTSWITAVFAFAVLYFMLEQRPWRGTTKAAAGLLALPIMLAGAGAANLLLIGLFEGFSGPSWTIFRAALP